MNLIDDEIYEDDFSNVLEMIKKSRFNALKSVNNELINLYWNIGKLIYNRVEESSWGQSVVKQLSNYLRNKKPELKGFSKQNLWRMKQFYEIYKDYPKLSTVLREITWSHNLAIFSRCKTMDEREFYIFQTKKEKWSFRELDRQISSSLYERMMLSDVKLSPKLLEAYPSSSNCFKDTYVFEFLNLKNPSENQLQKALIENLKDFILELGRDFLFIGEEYRIQVGNTDFFIDLLFFNRGLQCLVAFELKIDKFKPEYIGQLNFYLEALDRDVKKENENPSIGILLCNVKDDTVVEYALSRSLSPSMVAQYETILPDKKLLREKLNQIINDKN